MCTSIVEIVPAEGMAKGSADTWFPLTHAVVSYDHARHALLADAITIDFINAGLPPSARAAVELTLESAKALQAALTKAIAEAEVEEAERAHGLAVARRRATVPAGMPTAPARRSATSSVRRADALRLHEAVGGVLALDMAEAGPG